MDKRDQAYPRPGTAGLSHGIPSYHGTIGRDGRDSILQTWDCWVIPWDPKLPWDYRTGWTRGTKHTPNLGLLGCPVGSQGTIGQ